MKDYVIRLDTTELIKKKGLKTLLDALAEHFKQDNTKSVLLVIDNIEQSGLRTC